MIYSFGSDIPVIMLFYSEQNIINNSEMGPNVESN